MGQLTLFDYLFFDYLRDWIAGVAFAIYLRASRMTEEEFLSEHERQAVEHSVQSDGALARVFYCHCPSCNATGLPELFLRRR